MNSSLFVKSLISISSLYLVISCGSQNDKKESPAKSSSPISNLNSNKVRENCKNLIKPTEDLFKLINDSVDILSKSKTYMDKFPPSDITITNSFIDIKAAVVQTNQKLQEFRNTINEIYLQNTISSLKKECELSTPNISRLKDKITTIDVEFKKVWSSTIQDYSKFDSKLIVWKATEKENTPDYFFTYRMLNEVDGAKLLPVLKMNKELSTEVYKLLKLTKGMYDKAETEK